MVLVQVVVLSIPVIDGIFQLRFPFIGVLQQLDVSSSLSVPVVMDVVFYAFEGLTPQLDSDTRKRWSGTRQEHAGAFGDLVHESGSTSGQGASLLSFPLFGFSRSH